MTLIFRRFLEFISLIVLLPLGLVFLSNDGNSSSLDKIKASGSLIVLTVSGPTTYYTGPFGNVGYEYDLAQAFADFLGVELVIKTADAFQDLLPMLSEGSAHLAAAGITVTEGRKEHFKFGPVTEKITQQLIYRQGEKRPRDISQIRDDDIQVVASKQYLSKLKTLKQAYPELHWNKHQDSNSEALMHSVWQGRAEYAIANSNEIALTRLYYPELYVAFDLSGPMELAWAFPNSEDTSLYDQAVRFFDSINADGSLRQIHNRYYGHVHHLGYVGKHTFMQQVYKRLPKYEAEFEKVAQKYNLDWRF